MTLADLMLASPATASRSPSAAEVRRLAVEALGSRDQPQLRAERELVAVERRRVLARGRRRALIGSKNVAVKVRVSQPVGLRKKFSRSTMISIF